VLGRNQSLGEVGVDGAACSYFMQKMDEFCENYFDAELPGGGFIADSILNISNLKYGLIRLSKIWSGIGDQTGLQFYLSTSKKWDESDLTSFDALVTEYISEIKRSLWRAPATEHIEEPWRKPWIMPKLHATAVHIKQVVKFYGFYGVFSEEGMEHMQQVSGRLRKLHSPNKCLGGQIIDDMQYNAVLSSPHTRLLRKNAEKRCLENGRPIKKLRFQ